MKESEILMNAETVRSVLDGRKTQMRRIVKASSPETHFLDGFASDSCIAYWTYKSGQRGFTQCPYGKIGDRLWVKEALRINDRGLVYDADGRCVERDVIPVEWEDVPRRPHVTCIFMPRWASRITLEIAEIRVQRLQEISEGDALAEGCKPDVTTEQDVADMAISDAPTDVKELTRLLGQGCFPPRTVFRMLWDEINGSGSWDADPWVWAVSFTRLRPLQHKAHENVWGKSSKGDADVSL